LPLIPADIEYLDLLREVMTGGEKRATRNGEVRHLFGRRMQFDLGEGFPLLTTKRVFWKGIVEELLWMLRGSTNSLLLEAEGVDIWKKWADAEGDLGPIYGKQWRSWEGRPTRHGVAPEVFDQIAMVVDSLRHEPWSRRHVVSAWNVAELDGMALPPCHALFQFHVTNTGRLDCQLYQRSGDLFLGIPFNIASYALLTCMIARVTGLEPGVFTHVLGDVHLYEDHRKQAIIQLERIPRLPPRLTLMGSDLSIDGWTRSQIILQGYDPHPALPADVAK
jgi:thymidylate synthase